MKLTIELTGTPEEVANGLSDLGFSLTRIQNQLRGSDGQIRLVSPEPSVAPPMKQTESEMAAELKQLRRSTNYPGRGSSQRTWDRYNALRARRDALVQQMMALGYRVKGRSQAS